MLAYDFVKVAAERFRDLPALVDARGTLSFSGLWQRSRRLADAFIELGVKPGDRVLAGMTNRSEWVEVEVACSLVGAVRGRINWRDSVKEWSWVLKDLAPTVVVVAPEIGETIATIRAEIGADFTILDLGPAGRYEACLAAATEKELPVVDLDAPGAAAHTSGTTGRMKAALYTHKALAARHRNALALVLENASPQSAILHVGPITHMSGLLILPGLFRGARSVMMEHFSPEEFCDVVEKERITHALLAPTIINMVTRFLKTQKRDLSSLERVFYGASPMPPAQLVAAIEAFGRPIFMQGYGSSEGGGLFNTVLYPEAHVRALLNNPARLASCGCPTPFFDVKICTEEGESVPQGEVGEIRVRGDAVSYAYWNQPEATAQSYIDGWFRSGDLGIMDEEGYITLVDRKHDMIISGGLNIYPNEVEAVLCAHPSVVEAAVVGVPDEKWGETVRAFVVLVPGQVLTLDDVQDHCRSKGLAHYKKPTSVEFLTSLPKTAVGKISRRMLRETGRPDT